ncbi:hypothetical protein J6TS7_21020 [Paenibacillus dendritiformis]|uniref:hypothetical protein n=1 Tax=Paenibacillus TaxID=44249 RepID=UPI001B11E26E|nr:hypothetical protein [Paenibacillus dendritiformis]GIO78492.1 hypothetical protein J6TS7_21020 [Paenibacillus dendritiformis]
MENATIDTYTLKLIQRGTKDLGGIVSCFGWKDSNIRLIINELTGEVLDIYKCDPSKGKE